MIDLHPVTLEDKAWIDPLVWAEASSSADFNFGNIFLWDDSFHQLVGELGGRVVVLPCYDHTPFFAYPVGPGALAPVLREMEAHARGQGVPFTLRGVTKEHLPLIEAVYPGRCEVTAERPLWDYIYSAEKLATLSGKHLHGKRNHIHRFEAEYEWSFAPMTAGDHGECLALLDEWLAANPEDLGAGSLDERTAILRAFEHYDALGLLGGVLRANGRLAAFTMGEPLCAHTFVVHFEKARADINGAYPMVNREFVRLVRETYPDVQWINREDDMGLESLRQSKESYHPDRLVDKYMVVIHDA